MKKLDYYVLDVFTDQRYKGNQLSVVHLENELTIQEYHAISREFGYSETSFLHYSKEQKALKVRSFTPAEFEVAGAGHNLLGAVCLALLKKWAIFKDHGTQPYVYIKDTKIPLLITAENGLPYVGMKQRPVEVIGSVPVGAISEAIGLSMDELALNDWPVKIAQTEVPHLMIPVRDEASLQKAIPRKPILKEISEKYGFEGYYLFTTNISKKEYLAEARFFNPGMGIDEDPATGTAAGPLAGYLELLGYIKKNQQYQILQGNYVEHPSTIRVEVVENGIWVSGSSIIVMEGQIYV
jgi:trans-2,3-dihydro-3-hydroxyanthranilate isomerase